MQILPLALKIADQPCLVVGGGAVARRKIELLASADADVTVVARQVAEASAALCERHGIAVLQRSFVDADVAGKRLVVAATNDATANEAIRAACEQQGVLVNCVDDGERSNVLFPALVDRGSVVVAISTGGASPTLARRLRERIEAILPESIGALAHYLGQRRQRVRQALPKLSERQRFWDRAIDSELATQVARDDVSSADATLETMLAEPQAAGLVSLVGAGPGDPDLLTLKALRCLQQAEVVYYDSLVSAAVLARCRRDAERVHVGRRGFTADGSAAAGSGEERQAAINERLLADAKRGLRVVRLKGGDPLMFARGGEELTFLHQRGVAVEVVPGVTAALACAAAAGIPLTHRDSAQSVRFITARSKDGEIDADWSDLAKSKQTLVVYMGLAGLATFCKRLITHGAAADTPAATVSRATLGDERVVRGSLRNLAAKVEDAHLEGPATTIIGAVAALSERDDDAGVVD